MKKRILSIVLCLSMFIATFATTMVVSAAEVNAETGYCAEISDYRAEDNFTAPTKEGKVFAGWYEDAEFTTAIAPSKVSGEAYAKFVDPAVFAIKNQFNSAANTLSDTADFRIITTVDSEWYAEIEFVVTIEGLGTATLPIDTIYTSIVNYDPASAFCADSKYFAVEKITGIPAAYFDKKIDVAPKFTTYDGTVFDGTTREDVVFTQNLPVAEITVDAQNGLGFTTTGTDSFATGVMTAIEGGIFVNGTLSETATLEKTAANTYIINGVSETEDTIVKVDGKYGTDTHFASIFVAYGREGSRWGMAKTGLFNLKPFAETNGSDVHGKYLACSISAQNVKGANTWTANFGGLYPIAGAAYLETAGVKTEISVEFLFDYETYGANLHIDCRSVVLPNVVEGAILTFTGVLGNSGMSSIGLVETPVLVEGVSFVFKNGQWNTYVPTPYAVEYKLTAFAIGNRNVSSNQAPDKNLVASIVASNDTAIETSDYYYGIEGGLYVNDSKVPMDNYITISGGYLYIWSNNDGVGFAQAGKKIAIEEGTKLTINGVFGNPGVQEANFKISNARFIFLDGKWVSYTDEISPGAFQYNATSPVAELRFKNVFPGQMATAWGDTVMDYAGGIYVNGSETPIRDIRLQYIGTTPAEQLYNVTTANMRSYVGAANMEADGTTIKPGTIVRFYGVFRHASNADTVVLMDQTCIYKQNSSGGYDWFDYTE